MPGLDLCQLHSALGSLELRHRLLGHAQSGHATAQALPVLPRRAGDPGPLSSGPSRHVAPPVQV